MTFLCCSDHRRAALQDDVGLNGIDYLDVSDLAPGDLVGAEAAEYAALPANQRDRLLWQRRLTVFFVNPLLPAHLAVLTDATLRIEGGERPDSRKIGVDVLSKASNSIVLRTSRRGDFSRYVLRIITSDANPEPPAVFDPLLSGVDFSFKVECPSEFDCAVAHACPPGERPEVDLDYLARDYGSFRRLMLDRMSALNPTWRERHAADVGVAIVEAIAYVADYLSYRQEAIATEAYLGTARSRVSVRRHARLVDYPMHDGCNARVWVQIVLDSGAPPTGIILPYADPATDVRTRFLTRSAASPVLDADAADDLLRTQHPEVFELLLAPGETEPRLYPQHNELPFYTWGASNCCLPTGATRATLAGKLDRLAAGQVLIFEEVCGPRTGEPGDADPSHRQAVRLTDVKVGTDPLGGQFADPPTSDPVDVTEIAWASADALRFPLCASATIEDDDKKSTPIVVSVARGNIVLADHGRSVVEPLSAVVPGPKILRPLRDANRCDERTPEPIPPRFRPALSGSPLTHATPYESSKAASAALQTDVGRALPKIRLETGGQADMWDVRRDLLRSSGTAPDFVVEIESDGRVRLRFGDDTHGRRPTEGTAFTAFYRIGNGVRGNVGADSIGHISTSVAGIDRVRNPMPAAGGVDPEHVEDVRRFAPVAFRTQERAVTAGDYARMAERHRQIQQAAATFRWTGSWRTVFVSADPLASKDPDAPFDPDLAGHLEPYRTAGHDLAIDTPRYVPVEIDMQVCARREYFRSDVKRALLELFSSRVLPDGRHGVFHPDNFTFGQPIFLSRLYAAAYSVNGVETVRISKFQRQGTPDATPLTSGRLDFGRLEIARLENSADFPERGVFRLDVAGGK